MIVDKPACYHVYTSVCALNEDLDRHTNWAQQWIVKFSLVTTKSLLLKKNVNDPIPPMIMDGCVVEVVTS